MIINDLPNEIVDRILEKAASLNKSDGVKFTFGLSQAPQPYVAEPKREKYVSGMQPPVRISVYYVVDCRL